MPMSFGALLGGTVTLTESRVCGNSAGGSGDVLLGLVAAYLGLTYRAFLARVAAEDGTIVSHPLKEAP